MTTEPPLSSDEVSALLHECLLSHFFANLALSADAQETLTNLGMGRPHHRILSLASQLPGITVYGVLEMLRVSHQNVRLPMRKLQEEGLLESRPGEVDKRQRALYVTPKGRKLLDKLRMRQWMRVERSFRDVGVEDFRTFLRVQRTLLDPQDAETVSAIMARKTSFF